jgi:hypothetical protein
VRGDEGRGEQVTIERTNKRDGKAVRAKRREGDKDTNCIKERKKEIILSVYLRDHVSVVTQ